jgi:hypothetical protein
MADNISNPYVMKSAAGFYIGRTVSVIDTVSDNFSSIEPYDRLSDYFATITEAEDFFNKVMPDDFDLSNYEADSESIHPFITYVIRSLNDKLRIYGRGGTIIQTQGVAALDEQVRKVWIQKMRSRGQNDFAKETAGDHSIFWKIDYYDLSMQYASEHPENKILTERVLTVMLPSEY